MPVSFPPVDDPRKRVRRMYRAQNAIWLWIAAATIISAVQYFLDPSTANQSAAGLILSGVIEGLYYVLLGGGGAIVGYGVWKLEPRAEIIGHIFMGTGVAITSIAIFTIAGFVVSGLTLFGVAIANGFRVYYLWSVAPRRGKDG